MHRVVGAPGGSYPEDTHRLFAFPPPGVCLSLRCASDFIFLSAAFRKPLAVPRPWTGCLGSHVSTREGSGIQVGGVGDLEHTTSQPRPGTGAARQGPGTQCCAGGVE